MLETKHNDIGMTGLSLITLQLCMFELVKILEAQFVNVSARGQFEVQSWKVY